MRHTGIGDHLRRAGVLCHNSQCAFTMRFIAQIEEAAQQCVEMEKRASRNCRWELQFSFPGTWPEPEVADLEK